MNAPTTTPETSALATAESSYEIAPMPSPGNTALILDPRHMTNMMAVANAMATAKVTIPQHLQSKPGDCLAVVMQATQWGMNPFAVAQKTHIVNGTLGYEAQLVHAVLQATGAIEGTFRYEYQGDNAGLQCRVGAVCAGDKQITWGEWLTASSVTTKNSPLWKTNPKQQMGYLQVKNWARAFKPGAILGVYTTDELETIPPRDMGRADVVTPQVPPELIKRGQDAATKGVASYQEFWKGSTQLQRGLLSELSDWHDKLKQRAADADKSRTVDNANGAAPKPTPDPSPAPTSAPAADDAPFQATYARVMDMMTRAVAKKDPVALDVGADWIGSVEDPQQRRELAEKYEQFKREIEGDQS